MNGAQNWLPGWIAGGLLICGAASANVPPVLELSPASGPIGPGAALSLTISDGDGLADLVGLEIEVELDGQWRSLWPGRFARTPLRIISPFEMLFRWPSLGTETQQSGELRFRVSVEDSAGQSTQAVGRYHDAIDPPFAQVTGLDLTIRSVPFHAAGFNNYYCMVYSASPGLTRYIDELLDEAERMNLSLLRTWAFNDGAAQWNALQTSPGVYQEFVFRGLDRVVYEAGQHGFRLVLVLVNNWDDYGGMNQYVAWSPTASSHDDFYSDANCRAFYKAHIRAVQNRVNSISGVRYRDDPTILAWELANEPECGSDPSGVTVLDWLQEMARHLKSGDPNHLVTAGSQGFYGPADAGKNPLGWMSNRGVDYIRNNQLPEIDFATFHSWPDHWGMHLSETRQWIADHLLDARDRLVKPVLLTEFGKLQPVWLRDVNYQAVYDDIFTSAASGGAAAGSLFWQLLHDDYVIFDDGFGVFDPAHGTTVEIIGTEAQRIHALR